MRIQYETLLQQAQQQAGQLRRSHELEIQQKELQAAESDAATREVNELRTEQKALRQRVQNADLSLQAMAQRSQSASQEAESQAYLKAKQDLDQQRAQSREELQAGHQAAAALRRSPSQPIRQRTRKGEILSVFACRPVAARTRSRRELRSSNPR